MHSPEALQVLIEIRLKRFTDKRKKLCFS